MVRMSDRSTSFKVEYGFAEDFCNRQLEKFWVAKDYNMKDDDQDFRVVLNKDERVMVIQTQKIFPHYESKLGIEFWNGKFKKMYPRYEFERVGAVFGMMETAVHSPFYVQMIDCIGFNTEEFHDQPLNDSELNSRLEFISESLKGGCNLRVLAAMCFIEGTALFASFAALISFRKPQGVNAMKNMVSGLIHSCEDELLHCGFAAECFKQELKENSPYMSEIELASLENDVRKMATDVTEHEKLITKKLFPNGDLRNIRESEVNAFVEHRAQECLGLLGYKKNTVENNPIADWFYVCVQAYNYGDFFSTTQKDYVKTVDQSKFTWGKHRDTFK